MNEEDLRTLTIEEGGCGSKLNNEYKIFRRR